MKKIVLVIFSLLLISCNGKSTSNPFENCDRIDYYHLSEIKESEYMSSEPRNAAMRQILHEEKSINLEDSAVQKALKEFYDKEIIDAKLRVEISKLFTDPKMEASNASFSVSVAICAPVYRDILVFKKDNKVSAIAKVCFGCNQNLLWTKFGETRNAPLDYYKLEKHLKK